VNLPGQPLPLYRTDNTSPAFIPSDAIKSFVPWEQGGPAQKNVKTNRSFLSSSGLSFRICCTAAASQGRPMNTQGRSLCSISLKLSQGDEGVYLDPAWASRSSRLKLRTVTFSHGVAASIPVCRTKAVFSTSRQYSAIAVNAPPEEA
jgi:hypothetical protein